ncbi:hypothetical protein ACKLNO_11160 [Neisseriaceae bacterium B1]
MAKIKPCPRCKMWLCDHPENQSSDRNKRFLKAELQKAHNRLFPHFQAALNDQQSKERKP